MTSRSTFLMAITALSMPCSSAKAGTVLITDCNPGSSARIYWFDGIGINGTTTEDLNGDGDMADPGETVIVPNQDSVVEILVCKEKGFDGGEPRTSWKEHWLQPTTLAALEPFSTPSFQNAPSNTGKKVAPVIDVPAFAQSGVTFNPGQVLTVTNGTIAATNSIFFKDATGIPEGMITELFDRDFLNSLPNYNGEVEVSGPDQFQELTIPATSTWGIIAFALLVTIGGSVLLRYRTLSGRAPSLI